MKLNEVACGSETNRLVLGVDLHLDVGHLQYCV